MNENMQILSNVYDTSKSQSKTIGAMLTHVNNKSLRGALLSQIIEYDKISRDAGEMICALGKKPKTSHPVKEKLSVWNAGMRSHANPAPSNIAKMVSLMSHEAQDSTVGTMNSCINSSPTSYNLARRLVKATEKSHEKMQSFL